MAYPARSAKGLEPKKTGFLGRFAGSKIEGRKMKDQIANA
jgi:hypothetical protein